MSRSQDDNVPESSGHGQGDDLGLKTAFEESWSKMGHTEAVKFLWGPNYNKVLEETEAAKKKPSGQRTTLERRRVNRFDVLRIGDAKTLIVPGSASESSPAEIKFYVKTDDLFQVLREAHIAIGHGGKHRMEAALSKKYKNIPRSAVMLYVSLCQQCQRNRNVPRRGLAAQPLLLNEMSSPAQCDLIDFQSQPDGEYKWALMYQDHLTKFCILRPLKTKRGAEVAYILIDIFCLLGAPNVLQTDNGREFQNEIARELKAMWPQLKIVRGRPPRSESQGSVERANQDVKEMLSAWTKENQTPHWAEGLRFVQFHKNSTLHQGINQSPYEAMFGKKAKLGLKNSSLPKEITDALETKHELEKTPTQIQIGEEQPPTHCTGSSTPEVTATVDDHSILEVPEEGQNGFGSSTKSHVTEAAGTVCGAHTCAVFKDVVHAICGETLGGDEGYGSKIICSLCTKKTNLKIQRKRANSCLAKQAKKMRSGREEVSTFSSWNYSADPNPSYGPWST
ncbi:KRAB-A domain-containing protein 2-like [Huso huso]|uniref:Gypsy retrotransposon integrase-like protein 1 n=1 Tax=Huso huso TaxID=61971 RepID=A0ABR0YZR1_HUSHU